MIEGNRRVDELIGWSKNHPGEMPPLTEQEKYEFFTKKGMPVPGSGASVVDTKGFKMTTSQSTSKPQLISRSRMIWMIHPIMPRFTQLLIMFRVSRT